MTVTWADFLAWERQLTTCTHPIRLRGRIDALDLATGELALLYNTTAEHGVLHVACGNRRETVCPACSAVYKRDARQLVRAGLAGGKGIPDTIAAHPCVFATLTAPSFGPVHARRMRGKTVLPCRPRRDANTRRCPHGRDISCPTRHVEADPRLGQPMCPDCYAYEAAVLFNARAASWCSPSANPSTREAMSSTEARYSLPSSVQISVPSPYHLRFTCCAGKSRLTRSGARQRPFPGRSWTGASSRFAARPRLRMIAATVFWLTFHPASRRSAVTRGDP
jgi:hypothetical protein